MANVPHIIQKNSIFVFDKTMEAERIGQFYKNFGKASEKTDKKSASKVMINPGRPLENGTKIGTAALCENGEAAFLLKPKVINFITPAKDLIPEILWRFSDIPCPVQSFTHFLDYDGLDF